MSEPLSLVIRGGEIVDGTGGRPYKADIGIVQGKIVAIDKKLGRGEREIDARNLLVTPGFIDPHTHYDAQLTWSDRATPSSWNGATTILMGNCGVGFAPCLPENRNTLVRLMEGVEDIPGPVLNQGLPWNWQSFPEFLDALGSRQYDVDIAAQIPHAAVRVQVMGERGLDHKPATNNELAMMRRMVAESVTSGAFGVSTSRTRGHISADGKLTPTYGAAELELQAISLGLTDAGSGWLQLVSDFEDMDTEFGIFRRVGKRSQRPISITVLQRITVPDGWRHLMDLIADANAEGIKINGQVIGRATGVLLGFELSQNPFMARPSYARIAHLPFDERIKTLRQPDFRTQILSEKMPPGRPDDAEDLELRIAKWDRLFPLGDPPDYEPRPEDSCAGRAAKAGVNPDVIAYDWLLEKNGKALLYRPFSNYGYGNLDAVRDMIRHPNSLIGLGDAGAHVAGISDASAMTFLLTHWTRDRKQGGLFPVEWAVKRLTSDIASALGMNDRGRIALGYKADLNVIDYGRLNLRMPEVLYDLPGGARRLVQKCDGYAATIVSGVPVYLDGKPTGELPGRLVRGARLANAT